MAETTREIERKYEATPGTPLPDLTRIKGVAEVVHRGTRTLDAVYHDTPGLRLAAEGLTLRRRTGGPDAGWHLKFPVAPGVRDELGAPLADTLPEEFAALLRSRLRGAPTVPVVRLRTTRDVRLLHAADGTRLAELSVDTVHAERLPEGPAAHWTEIEVELAEGTDPALLDALGTRLRKAGIRPSAAPSKLARALAETGRPPAAPAPAPGPPGTAGAVVLAYVREQTDAIVALDPAVRRDLPDAVHRMRVACRRLRGTFRTYRRVLDRDVTDHLAGELRWLARELGAARDREVLDARLRARVTALPRPLVRGPVKARLRHHAATGRQDARRRVLAALDSARHLALLDSLAALHTHPPLRKAAHRKAPKVLARALAEDHARLAERVGHALALDPGKERDLALHEARKAAKRTRYAAEAARPALGKPAKRMAKRVKAVQSLLGEHQDAVVARRALRGLGAEADAAGEPSFTWGLLHGHEESAADRAERELPRVWSRAGATGIEAAFRP
ncbi:MULTISPECIES: CYTH and CHAD domain-containing protein [unclassified Streptomyces]|uniref:CYTH and CHAD domain-containing protein n=1 Tax=unclassified Streptomyces TaxID=2593676 RepID=UPI0016603175|nr:MULTISPECIES: CYTH and CHAD domain-containing protein [unclassified Streptomyces]MBD0709744.1 metal-binding protein [Streptomyces sp. CBMA291]MBD0715291.1 metal-binding protein [Streptomyces sp. CBMA370]